MPKAPKTISHVNVTIGGRRRRLRFCARSAMIAARDYGISLQDIMPPVEEVDGEYKAKDMTEAEAMDFQMRLIWFGLIAYEPTLTQEDMEMDMLLGELPAAGTKAMEAFTKFMPGAFSEEEEDEEGETKAVAA